MSQLFTKSTRIMHERIAGIIFEERIISETIGNEDVYYFRNRVVGEFSRGCP
jgi:hypothetical protein